jgi:hypothetical protein
MVDLSYWTEVSSLVEVSLQRFLGGKTFEKNQTKLTWLLS